MSRSEPVTRCEFVIACVTAIVLAAAVAAYDIYDRIQAQQRAADGAPNEYAQLLDPDQPNALASLLRAS